MKALNVFYKSQIVGELRLVDNDQYQFQYDKRWLAVADAFSISFALPLQEKPYGHVMTKSFFEGLIPEEDFLRQIEMRANTPIGSAFDFLSIYGKDCAGALVITSDKKIKAETTVAKKISFSDLSKAFKERKTLADVVLNDEGGFFSLAGAQDKIPLLKKGENYFIPQGGQATTHIVKPPNRFHQALDSVYNEYFCMQLAEQVGLEVPKTFIVEDEVPFYVIERYDRAIIENKVQRIHQQDFCQAAGVLSSQKYEILGGPSIKNNYHMILNHSSNVIHDSRRFLKWILFNLLIGNNDSHSKNISFLLEKQSAKLSPFYDILSTAVYPSVRNKFAFKVAGQLQWNSLSAKHLRALEKELKLKNLFLSEVLSDLIKDIEKKYPTVLKQMDIYKDQPIFEKIGKEITKRAKHFKGIV